MKITKLFLKAAGTYFLAFFMSFSAVYAQNYANPSTYTPWSTSAGASLSGGVFNAFYGDSAGYKTTNGSYNTFIGESSGYGNISGNQNLILGYLSGYNSNGSGNIISGFNAGYNNSGNYNVISGYNAGYNNMADYNVISGYNAGYSDSGMGNIISGSYAGAYSTSNSYLNVLIGWFAGSNNNGYSNVILGNGAGTGNNGNRNIIMGEGAGTNVYKDFNVIIGPNSGINNYGNHNIITGYQAGDNNGNIMQNSNNNIITGYQAGQVNNGNNNIILGTSAAWQFNSGDDNILIGDHAGQSNGGASNIIIGAYAGSFNGGINNTFLGNNTGYSNYIGSNNSFLGNNAGYNSYSNNNTFLGDSSGYNVQGGPDNTAVGHKAGMTINSTDAENTFLGSGADAISSGISNSTAIGYGAKVGASNKMVFGNYSVTNWGLGINTSHVFEIDPTALGGSGDFYIDAADLTFIPQSGGIFNVQPTTLTYNMQSGGTFEIQPNDLIYAPQSGGMFDVQPTSFTYHVPNDYLYISSGLSYTNAATDNLSISSGLTYTDVTGDYLNISSNSFSFVPGIGGGTFTGNASGIYYASDRNIKENFTALNYDNILNLVSQLDISQWNYKGDSTKTQHIGPMAQDFKRIFNVGQNSTTMCVIDPAGVALAAIKGLIAKGKLTDSVNSVLQNQNAQLQQTVDAQSAQIADQNSRLATVEAKLEQLATMQEQCCMAANPPASPSMGSVNNTTNTTLQDNTTQSPRLDQNIPNPFDGSTTIAYFIPANAQSAVITISTTNGKPLKTFIITGLGNGQIELDSQTLSTGLYLYNLVVDGKQIDSKKMSVVKD